ncbi:probable 2-oxoglutarate-dependent dioxygenase AOP1 [Populus nigra]|uniref:probable 2-oxoglutarate-dependent dioxygenase AOP1 n=1 Tax=Populus nigra TaxID=3691 RepID=UPI002B26C703|nr:probable 2-oxoglutarate-dependent dioxygenase AOP1 [Populus nigra]
MSQETPFQLPIIDFCKSDLKPGTSEWDLVKSRVWKAISEHGCFKALLDKIPLHVEKSFLGEVKELFDIPLQTKRQHVSEIPFYSYFGKSTPPLQYESFGIEDPSIFDNCNNFTNVLWPHGNPDFRKSVKYFTAQVSQFEKLIRRMILESMGLDNYMDEHMSSTSCVLRVMKYQAPQITEPTYTKHHTDKNLITILYQNQVDGLEVQTKHGMDEWSIAPALPSIDFCKSDLKPGTSEWDLVKSRVWKAISEHGCFKALLDKIPLHVEKSFLGEVKELFDIPLQTKRQHVSEIPFYSYFGKSTPPLQYESFGIEDPSIFDNCNNFTNVLWPHGNPDFR